MALAKRVRALIEAHLLMSFNSGLRNAGLVVATAAVVGLLLIFGFFAVMVGILAFAGGVMIAPSVVEGRTGAAGLIFTGAACLGPLLSLAGGDGRELEWERFKLFPVTPAALFLSELIAMIGHPIMAMTALANVIFAAGLITGSHGLWVVAVPTAAVSLVMQAALRLGVASTAVRVMRRFRLAVLFLLVLLPLPVALGLQALEVEKQKVDPARLQQLTQQIDGTVQLAASVAASLPASAMLRVPVAVEEHSWLEVALGTVGPLLVLLLCAALAVRGVGAETSGGAAKVSRGPERLWTFSSPLWGIARLQLIALFDSQIGRFSLGMPLLWILPVFIGARMESQFPSHYVGLFAWVFVPTTLAGFLFNQFGLDRGAVKGLFLLPIPDVTVIRGKALGYAIYQGLQLVAVWVATWVLLRPPGYVLLAGPLTALYLFLVLLTIGQWTSTIWPRSIPRQSLKQAQGGFLFALISMTALTATMLPVSLLWLFLAPAAPWALPPVLGLVVVLAWLVQLRFSREAARMLALRRERIVESLG